MQVLKQILCDEIKKVGETFSIENLYDCDRVVVDSFPASKSVSIALWIKDFPVDRNQFKMVVKKESGELIGEGKYFRSDFITRDGVGFITTKFRDAHFLNRDTRYIIEYWNFDRLVTSLTIGAVEDWLEIYQPVGESGYALIES